MKRITLVITLVLLCFSIYAENISNDSITLHHTIPNHQRINIRYGKTDITSDAEFEVDLESGHSDTFSFIWEGNIGFVKNFGDNASVTLEITGFTHKETGAVTPVNVSIAPSGEMKEVTDPKFGETHIAYDVYGSDGAVVGTSSASSDDRPSIFFIPKNYTKDSFSIGEMIIYWERRNWPAGTYTCPVTIHFTAM